MSEEENTGEQPTGLEQNRGPGRRRNEFTRTAEEGEMTHEQFVFVTAIDVYKRVNGRPFPSWTEVLQVIRRLGYRKTGDSELNLPGVEDWTEEPDAPAFPLDALEEEAVDAASLEDEAEESSEESESDESNSED